MSTFYRRRGKRLLDVFGAAGLMIATAPVQAVVAIAVRSVLGTPVLFRQARPGLHGRPFVLLKFRTMADVRDDGGELLPDVKRLGRLGRFLRAASIDELPEAWNVLKGEMSLVGPRPLLPEYLPLYSVEQMKRHQVRPGITGLAQVSGRNSTTWAARLNLDSRYVDTYSFATDLQIILKTVTTVFSREGVYNPDLQPFAAEDKSSDGFQRHSSTVG